MIIAILIDFPNFICDTINTQFKKIGETCFWNLCYAP